MSADPRRVPDGVVPANGWHRLDADTHDGKPEETQNAGDDAMHEVTVYYAGDDGRFAEETYCIRRSTNPLMPSFSRLFVWQMSHVGQWAPDDPEHVGEPIFEDYSYDYLGLFDYEDTPDGMREALKVRDRFVAGDESDSYTY